MKAEENKEESSRKSKKTLISQSLCDTILWRMEVGFFFMPKNSDRELEENTRKARWKLCALESHWHVQNANSVTTT